MARIEAYDRQLSRVQSRYVSIDNSLDVFPETEPDRALLAPTSARASGVEMLVTRPSGQHLTWSATYAYAVANDEVAGRTTPRTLDGRHTVALDVGWHPSAQWRISGAWLYHTGWPTTPFDFSVDTLRNGSLIATPHYGLRNSTRLAPYHRLDLRATRTFAVRGTELNVFVDLFNAYNRRNERAFDPLVTTDGQHVTFGKRVDALLPRLPSFGLSWEF